MIPILYDHAEKDFTSQGICRLADAVDCFVTEERNGIYECELKYPIDGLYFEEIFEGRLIGATHDDNGDIQPFEIYKHSAPIDGIVTFYAHHLSYRLRNHILVPFHASSCTEAMSVMKAKSLNYCPFNFFTDVSTLGNFDVEYPVSIKSRLAGDGDSILNLYGPGEFKYDKWNVSFLESRGVDHGVEIRYGKNLTDITREYDESEVYTAIVPYWYKEDADGIKHLVMLDQYGIIINDSDDIQHIYWTNANDEVLLDSQGNATEFSSENLIYAPLDLSSEFDDEPTQAQLATRAMQIFNAAQPWLATDNIKISFIALWQTPEYENYAPLEKVSLCDIVHVIHTRIGVMVDAEVIKTVYNVLLDRYNEIELGSPLASYADEIQNDTQAALKEIQKQLRRSVTADYVNEKIGNATDKITGGLGGYVKVTLNADGEPQEILIMDHPSTETAVNVIRINQAGIGFSQSGYQGPFNSAWLIDGTFDAQVINVINLAATVIRTGYLTDAQGYNYWNLETGEFRLSSTAMLDTYKEYSYIATRDYAVGDKIEIQTAQDTSIYEVTTPIPKNSTIQPEVNVKAATAHTLLEFARKAETVANVDVEYASHTSSITPPPEDSSAWQTESPAWELGKYIWQRTKMTDGNGNNNYSDPVCIQGAQGTNSAIVYLYKRSATAATIDWTQTLTYSFATNKLTSLPNGWVDDLKNLPNNDNPIYITAATAGSRSDTDSIPYTEWSTPVVMAQNGEDAPKTAVVVLYKRSNTTPAKPTGALTYTFNTAKLTPASALAGWSQSIPVADGNPCYSIQAVAMAVGDTDTIAATEWTDATQILSDGLDAYNTAVVYLYMRSATAPSKPSVQTTYTFSDHSLSPIPSGWSRDYIGGSNPLYVTAVTASSTEASVDIAANEWSDPVILTQDGAPGANGKNVATIRLYKRATSAPSIDWLNDLVYSFETNHLTSVPTGWSESVPEGDDDLYATAATANSAGSTDTIAPNEWSAPVCITKNGLSWSAAAVFLYARADASTDLTKPTQTLDYSFSTGKLSRNGQTAPGFLGQWSQEIPATNGKPCFVIQATAVSDDGQTDSIAPSEWSDITLFVSDGENGEPGLNSATVFLYARAASASALTKPSSALTYTFASGILADVPQPWSQTIPDSDANGNPCFVIQATAANTTATDMISSGEWSDIKKLVVDGEDGRSIVSITEYYARNDSTTAPADNAFSTSVVNPTSSNKYLWNYEEITYSSGDPTKTAKRIIGTYGQTGDAGKGISSITNYYLATASGSGVTIDTSGWTTAVQSMTPTNKYLWNYESIAYTSGDPTTTTPTIIGVYGEEGAGVRDVSEQYYLSTSSSNCIGGSWQVTQPVWSVRHYIWTRSKITWTDIDSQTGTYRVSYTTPICANAINGANESVKKLDDMLDQDEVFRRLTNGFNTEGIYLENGRLFINSTGIATGFIHDKASISGTNIEFFNEKTNIATRDYESGAYISAGNYAFQTTKKVYKNEWINAVSTQKVNRIATVYSEESNIATRDYVANDYITFGGNLYKALVTIQAGATLSSSGFKNCDLVGTCYTETGYYATRAYSAGAYVNMNTNLYQVLTSLASGDLMYPGANATALNLNTMYKNYWNLNTGYFQTQAGQIGDFLLGEFTASTGATGHALAYLQHHDGGNYQYSKPYYAANTPNPGVVLCGVSSDESTTGYTFLSQGRMFVTGFTNYAGRVRINAGMIFIDLGLTPSSPTSGWTTIASVNPWTGTGGRGLNINGNLAVSGNLACTGSKPRIVDTDDYGWRYLYAYENPTPMFGDIGEGEIGEDGLCYVWLEPIFAQTIENGQYQVFLQKYGDGKCFIKTRASGYFIVQGTPGLTFGWEMKAKQKGYGMTRLQNEAKNFGIIQPAMPENQNNFADVSNDYLQNLREGRISE